MGRFREEHPRRKEEKLPCPQLQGMAKSTYLTKRKKVQKDPLSALMVKALESLKRWFAIMVQRPLTAFVEDFSSSACS